MAGITEIMGNIEGAGFASPNRFRVIIPGADAPTMFNCNSAQFPAINLVTTQDKRVGIGNLQTFVDGKELTQITLTFYESASFKERQFFSVWIDQIYDRITKKFKFFESYAKTIELQQLSKHDDSVIYSVRLTQAFPTHVSEMNRSYATVDQVEQFSVSIAYNDMEEIFSNITSPEQSSEYSLANFLRKSTNGITKSVESSFI